MPAPERIYLYDTTLRDGQQTQGVQFSAAEKTEIAQMLVESLTTPSSESPHSKLSDRELQTLVMIASGKRLADIAEEMKGSSEVQELVATLEQQYDALQTERPDRMPSADEIAAEFEKFLADREKND